MSKSNFYDNTPFKYGYSSKEDIIQNMHPFLKDLIRENSGKVICDIGCGCGRNLLYSSSFADKVIGVDLSLSSINFAEKFIESKKLELIQGNNLDIPLENNLADLVISDGVCHHTGDTFKAFSECVRILKKGGVLYLAVYKKFRYYPFIYYIIGGFFRYMNKLLLGRYILENVFIKFHYLLYKIFKKNKLVIEETRNIFFDYFLTPISTFHSKKEINSWVYNLNLEIINYDRTSGNCHVFIIKKHE